MSFLCQVADEFEVRLCIQAQAQSSGKQSLTDADLVSWYHKFGFAGNKMMLREPQI
jgi:hypothetical protein